MTEMSKSEAFMADLVREYDPKKHLYVVRTARDMQTVMTITEQQLRSFPRVAYWLSTLPFRRRS